MAYIVRKKLDGSTAERWEIKNNPVSFGRGDEDDVQSKHQRMSRQHFIIEPREENFVARDLNSTNGTSEPHLKAIADEIARRLRDAGIRPLHRDGFPPSRWIVMDYNDVLIHIFHPELRQRYGLEDLWGDAKRVK